MRVAFLGLKGLPSKSGADRVGEALVRRLVSKHEITVYCDAQYTPADFRLPGVRLVRLPTPPGKHSRALCLFLLQALHALVFGRYDLIHLHNAEACFVAPLLRLRYPVIATSHGQAYARDKWGRVAKLLIRGGDELYARVPNMLTSVSQPLAAEYTQRYGRKVHYIPNGVDDTLVPDSLAAAKTLQAYGARDGYILFAAGRMDPTKGCHLLLRAFQSLPDDVQLVVVGDTSTAPAYTRELHALADRRAVFIPFIASKAELFGIVQAARFFVFPSTVEAMSMMLMEVAALGVPIIASDIPENKVVLPDQALYFPSGDAESLSARLRWALGHPAELAEQACDAKIYVQGHFDWDMIAGRYDELYRQMAFSLSRAAAREGDARHASTV